MRKGGEWRSIETLEYESFEWDPAKQKSNLEKHGIDFVDAANGLLDPHIVRDANHPGEQRCIAVAMSGRYITIVYTVRQRTCRIISTRAARQNERKAYQEVFGKGNSKPAG